MLRFGDDDDDDDYDDDDDDNNIFFLISNATYNWKSQTIFSKKELMHHMYQNYVTMQLSVITWHAMALKITISIIIIIVVVVVKTNTTL